MMRRTVNLDWVTAFFSIFVSAVASVSVAFIVSHATIKAALPANAAQYIRIVGDKTLSPASRLLALTAMYKKNLVDPDALFDAAYDLENESNQRLSLQLLYVVGRSDESLPQSPIGYVDAPGGLSVRASNGMYQVNGWAIDDNGVKRVELKIDSTIERYPCSRNRVRPDIEKLFPNFSDSYHRLHSGFSYCIPVGALSPGVHHVSVMVFDKDFHFREIFSRDITFK